MGIASKMHVHIQWDTKEEITRKIHLRIMHLHFGWIEKGAHTKWDWIWFQWKFMARIRFRYNLSYTINFVWHFMQTSYIEHDGSTEFIHKIYRQFGDLELEPIRKIEIIFSWNELCIWNPITKYCPLRFFSYFSSLSYSIIYPKQKVNTIFSNIINVFEPVQFINICLNRNTNNNRPTP